MTHGHMMEVCQHGWTHVQCRCAGPKAVKTIVCNIREHALNPKKVEKVKNVSGAPLLPVPDDMEEYLTGLVSDDTMTKEIWETLISALNALDNAYGDTNKIDDARDWLHKQYGVWED